MTYQALSESNIPLEKLGKFSLIDSLTAPFKLHHPSSIHGVDEGVAIINVGDHYRLITSQLLLEGIHFDLTYCPLKHLGYKAITVNISDIAAKNGVTEQIFVQVAVSSKFPMEALEELYAGIYLACEEYQVDLVGAGMSASATGLVISVTAVGKVSKDKVCLRKGAQPHNIVCVTGDLGAAYLGLQVLSREKQVFQADPNMQPDLEPYKYLVQRQLKPEARMDIIQTLDQLQVVPSSMIDITDGLAAELFHISKAAKVGVTIYEERLPIDQATYETAVSFNLDPIMCAVNGGEDYELLFTIQQKDFNKIENHPDIACIGYVTDLSQGLNLVTKSGSMVPITAPGWEHGTSE
jgi:thiamine-monophosphate kinase